MDSTTQAPTPELVRSFSKPTDMYLCPLTANAYNIQFLKFVIRDIHTGTIFFQIQRSPDQAEDPELLKEIDNDQEMQKEYRTVRYRFGPNFFDLKDVGTSLVFSVGDKPVKNFLMIERHYFQEKLIQSYEFKFPFCIPNSTNEWQAIYSVPTIDEDLKKQMIESPYETQSDSFYFVENVLVMHNKAEYDYTPNEDDA